MPKFCVSCNTEIHPKRVEILPNTKTCVNCSTIEKKGGMIVQLGEGDHTCTEIVILDRDELKRIEELQSSHKKLSSGNIKKEIIDEEDNTEDDDLSDLRIIDNDSDDEDEENES